MAIEDRIASVGAKHIGASTAGAAWTNRDGVGRGIQAVGALKLAAPATTASDGRIPCRPSAATCDDEIIETAWNTERLNRST
jgi:hypothetical protein